jgi:protein gp37
VGEVSHISWTDATFNPWIGCTKVSVGDKGACELCYAEALSARYGFAQWGNHPRKRTSEANWRKPLAWDRRAAKEGMRPFVFCASLADVFDNQVDPMWRFDLFELIKATPNLTWLLLTKRPQNIMHLFREALHLLPGGEEANWPFNAAIGFTAVTQLEIDRDSKHALAAYHTLKPAFLFCSGEPLMEAMDIPPGLLALGDRFWMISGGETDQGGRRARPSHPDWFRSLRDQCAAAGVTFHMKQMTRRGPIPADLQIQDRPS